MHLYGHFFICIALALYVYGIVAQGLAVFLNKKVFFESSRVACLLAFFSLIGASLVLWVGLFSRNFNIAYIQKNSSHDLPFMYTFTAFWSSLEGSHLLWTVLIALFSVSALFFYREPNRRYLPYVCIFSSSVLIWMLLLALGSSEVFALTPFPMMEGSGMNALLQNPYMAIHPPMLFVAYAMMIVPFGYALAALVVGDVDLHWMRVVRSWSLMIWVILTVAITLGGRWAYLELGWAGYWAWDPVENASLVPWLIITALLHVLLLQQRLGQLKTAGIALAIAVFFFSFFGTFMTRSGIITSVHSFAESNIGMNYLIFLGGLFLVSTLLFFFRAHAVLPTRLRKLWGNSKESLLLATIFGLLSFAGIVVLGTIFPVLSEWFTDQRMSVQAPYFNKLSPMFAVLFILGIALANHQRFTKKMDMFAWVAVSVSAGIALIFTLVFCFFIDFHPYSFFGRWFFQLTGAFLIFWSVSMLFFDLWNRVRVTHPVYMFSQHRAYLGGWLAHLGFLVLMFGVLGGGRGLETELPLEAGETKSAWGYDVTFRMDGLQMFQEHNAQNIAANLIVTDVDQTYQVRPMRSKYPTSNELFNEIAIVSNMWRDLYFVLKDFDEETGQSIVIQLNYNPTVKIVWWAIGLMAVGGLISFSSMGRVSVVKRRGKE